MPINKLTAEGLKRLEEWHDQMLVEYEGRAISEEQEMKIVTAVQEAGNPDFDVKRLRRTCRMREKRATKDPVILKNSTSNGDQQNADPCPQERHTTKSTEKYRRVNRDGMKHLNGWYSQILIDYQGVPIPKEQEIKIIASIIEAGNPFYDIKRLQRWYRWRDAQTKRMGNISDAERSSSVIDHETEDQENAIFSAQFDEHLPFGVEMKATPEKDLVSSRLQDHVAECMGSGAHLKQAVQARNEVTTAILVSDATSKKSEDQAGTSSTPYSSETSTSTQQPNVVVTDDFSLLKSGKIPETWEELLEWMEPHDKVLDQLINFAKELKRKA